VLADQHIRGIEFAGSQFAPGELVEIQRFTFSSQCPVSLRETPQAISKSYGAQYQPELRVTHRQTRPSAKRAVLLRKNEPKNSCSLLARAARIDRSNQMK
jgi:hypothetical protein